MTNHNAIVRAINRMYAGQMRRAEQRQRHEWRDNWSYCDGLCYAFRGSLKGNSYEVLPSLLIELGADEDDRGVYFWPQTRAGFEQRMMFLAFLLTWDEEKKR